MTEHGFLSANLTEEVANHVLSCVLWLRALPCQEQAVRRLLSAVPLLRFLHGGADRGVGETT